MPLYKHNVTGNTATVSDDYVSAFPEGVWTKLADESPDEERERLQREAIENKVELEFDGDPDAAEVDPDNPVPDLLGVQNADQPDAAPAKPASRRAKASDDSKG